MDVLQLLGMVLDVTDAAIGMVAIVSLWYAWVAPAKQDRPTGCRRSGRAEIERFLQEAQSRTGACAGQIRAKTREPVKGALPRSGEC